MDYKEPPKHRTKKVLLKTLVWLLSILVLLGITVYASFRLSPWPSALLIRYEFKEDAQKLNRELAKYTPQGITSKLNIDYDTSNTTSDYNELMDVYYPENPGTTLAGGVYPVVVWVHGGAFIAGDKEDESNYYKILAARGYVVVSVNYSLAPAENYPVPVRQVNHALGYLIKNAALLKIDTAQIFLAGDSGGAHIVAQLSCAITNSSYASSLGISSAVEPKKIKGVILYCGPYDAELVNLDGPMKGFLNTVLWSYIGRKDYVNDPLINTFSVVKYVNSDFPRAFISAGNNDPLEPHSRELASVLSRSGVYVDSLFYPRDYAPGLPHEYQFDLDTEAGKVAMEKMVSFLRK